MDGRSTLELRLAGLPVPDGEIPLGQLAKLASHAEQLALRTARALVDAAGPGRSRRYVEDSARLSLTGIATGSTILELAGPPRQESLPLDDELADLSDRVFDSIGASFDRLARGHAPEMSGPALDSLDGLLGAAALNDAELEVTTTVAGRAPRRARLIPVDARAIVESALAARQPDVSPRVVSGELYKVDIHSGRFRIEDDLGGSIELIVADDPAAVAGLIGSRVDARGDAEYDAKGRILRVGGAVVTASVPLVDARSFWEPIDIDALLANAKPFDAYEGGIEDLEEGEIEAFLAAIRQ